MLAHRRERAALALALAVRGRVELSLCTDANNTKVLQSDSMKTDITKECHGSSNSPLKTRGTWMPHLVHSKGIATTSGLILPTRTTLPRSDTSFSAPARSLINTLKTTALQRTDEVRFEVAQRCDWRVVAQPNHDAIAGELHAHRLQRLRAGACEQPNEFRTYSVHSHCEALQHVFRLVSQHSLKV